MQQLSLEDKVGMELVGGSMELGRGGMECSVHSPTKAHHNTWSLLIVTHTQRDRTSYNHTRMYHVYPLDVLCGQNSVHI